MRKLSVLALLLLLTTSLFAQDREKLTDRLEASGTVLDEITAAPDKGIPNNILDDAKCVAVVPSLLKGGFIFGAAYGKGYATCRTDKGWSAPAPFDIKGGSFGFQIGGEAVDYVMVIMNERGMRALLSSKFKIGGDVSGAAGPVGRQAGASTDWKMRAEVLTYSRARGIFAGVTLNGALIKQNKDDTRMLYGRMVPFRTILTGRIAPPNGSEAFLGPVERCTGTAPAKPGNAAAREPNAPPAASQPAAKPRSTGSKPSAYDPPHPPR
jgi:lipid-binding SYLF domain-containing protein